MKNGHQTWLPLPIESLATSSESQITRNASGTISVSGENPRHDDYTIQARPEISRITGVRLEVLSKPGDQGYSDAEDGHVILTNVKFGVRSRGATQLSEIEVSSAVADYQNKKKGKRDYGLFRDVLDDDPRTGWTTNGADFNEPRIGVFQFAEPVVLSADESLVVELRHRSLRGFSSIRHFRLLVASERGPAVVSVDSSPREQLAAIVKAGGEVPKVIRERLWNEFIEDQARYKASRSARAEAQARVADYERASKPQKVMVLAERREKRETNVLVRGVWDQKGELVSRGVPAAFGNARAPVESRVELARWLIDSKNPLTARVTVNRYWQMYFGHGLVRTPEDFGMQGEAPTHPQLLDWLAAELIASGWNVKHLQKLIVSSACYRQQSDSNSELIRRDPENRLLARATRFRLPSWMIRDAALGASGLLVNRLGGPPVYPHQPPGLWADSTMGRFHYKPSVGSDLYRRSVYGFWRRSVGPALMFDASKRRVCQVRVTRTSTPLQALTLMNDRTFVEAACHMAVADDVGGEGSIAKLFEQVLSRLPSPSERMDLQEQFRIALAHYRGNLAEARELLSHVEASPSDAELPRRAALAVIGMTILNLDEAITRQ